MENSKHASEVGCRRGDLAERAEYDRLVKRFHEEEHQTNLKNLLFNLLEESPEVPGNSD